MKSFRLIYPVIVLLAAIACFGLRWGYTRHYADQVQILEKTGGDAADYFVIAYTLGQTGKYAHPANADYEKIRDGILRGQPVTVEAGDSDSWRPPVWPFVLMLMQKAAGTSVATLFALRFLLDVVTLLLFAKLLTYFPWSLWLKGVCLFAFALHPTWLLYSSVFLSEPLSMLMLVAFTVVLFHLLQAKRRVPAVVGCGILGGLVILTHPFFVFFPLLALGLLCWRRLLPFRSALAVLTLCALTVSPWLFRNMLLFHTAKPILTTSAGSVIGRTWNDDFLHNYRNTTAECDLSEIGAPSGLNAAQCSDWLIHQSLSYALQNWRMVPAIVTRKLTGAITPFPETYRPGLLEHGRCMAQVLTIGPVFWLLLFGFRPGQRSRLSADGGLADGNTGIANVRFIFPVLRCILGGLFLAYLLMCIVSYASIRFRAPLVWAELICLFIALDAFLNRSPNRMYTPGAEREPGHSCSRLSK